MTAVITNNLGRWCVIPLGVFDKRGARSGTCICVSSSPFCSRQSIRCVTGSSVLALLLGFELSPGTYSSFDTYQPTVMKHSDCATLGWSRICVRVQATALLVAFHAVPSNFPPSNFVSQRVSLVDTISQALHVSWAEMPLSRPNHTPDATHSLWHAGSNPVLQTAHRY